MTIPDPPWKQKTRPCPFYSQGRCLFADSCNFLHDVKIKVKPTDITTSVGVVPGITLTQSPTESDSSVSSPSRSLRRVRSPPRSPRLSSLLIALGDAIDNEDEDDDGGEDEPGIQATIPSFESARALVAASGIFGQVSQRRSATPNHLGHTADTVDVQVGGDVKEPAHAAEDVLVRTHTENPSLSAADEIPALKPETTSAAFCDDTIVHSIQRSVEGGGGLLSPIEVTLAPPAYWPLGQLEPLQREDSVDSGYAEWIGPTPLGLSPPRSPRSKRLSTLDLLSSPFGTPARVLSPKFIPSHMSAWPTSPASLMHPVDVPDTSGDADVSAELDSPSAHATERLQNERTNQLEPELQSTIRPSDVPLARDDEAATLNEESRRQLEVQSLQTAPHGQGSSLPEPLEAVPQASDRVGSVLGTSPSSPLPALSSNGSTREVQDLDDALEQHEGRDGSILAYVTSPELSTPAAVFRTPQRVSNTPVLVSSIPQRMSSTAQLVSDAPQHVSNTPQRVFSAPQRSKPVASPNPSPKSPYTHFPTGSGHDTRSIPRKSFSLNTVPSPVPSTCVFASPANRPFHTDTSEHTPNASLSASPSVSIQSLPHTFSPTPHSAVTKQFSIPDFSSGDRESRASRKVPFGFRHSGTARSRDSSVSSRHTSTSRSSTRRRPPALTNLRSSLLSEAAEIMTPSEASSTFSKLKPLRLSIVVNSSSGSALSSSGITPSLTTSTTAASHSPSPSVSSGYSISHNALLSSTHSSLIPNSIRNTLIIDPQQTTTDESYPSGPLSAPLLNRFSWQKHPLPSKSNSLHDRFPSTSRLNSRLSEPMTPLDKSIEEVTLEVEEMGEDDDRDDEEIVPDMDDTIRGTEVTPAAMASRPVSVASLLQHEPVHAIATPRPTLLFAIASDNVDEVRRVLDSGEAGPNDDVGPQSALAFAVTAEQLKHKAEIVKLLLAHGANPASLRESGRTSRSSTRSGEAESAEANVPDGILAGMDAATKYYIARAEAPQMRRASALIHRSFFRPLAKVRYDMIGQDRALEQLFRVLSMPTTAPIVVLLCGPSGHGKSLLARKFGSLLDVPTHTVNMTTLQSTHDIWRSYSMSPYEPPSTCTLADFLMENEGKRCVVVLDEIEKTEDEKFLSSLLMPWELGRCSIEAGRRHVDVSKVIWLGTSNVGHDLVFEHQASRASSEEAMTREEYVDLMGLLRPKVSDRLGPSVLSRVTTVLPFIPFTTEEQKAIATEALSALADGAAQSLPSITADKLIQNALRSYIPAEGARSLYRAVSTELLDTLCTNQS